MNKQYDASSIEVLTGLDPVRKRPGMYTDTQNPNHLVQEVVDNSVDEALAGFATEISIKIARDGSIRVEDNGRGMPVDEHREKKVSAVEVILTTLHAGGKFSDENYQYSGGLHGVGVSVVNALSSHLRVEIKRDAHQYAMEFKSGYVDKPLSVVADVGKKNTGTTVHFSPDPSFFESAEIDLGALKNFLRAKAVLCPGLKILFEIESSEEKIVWLYPNGVIEYFSHLLEGQVTIPKNFFHFLVKTKQSEVSVALAWLLESSYNVSESYVNTIPTAQGGAHVKGLRGGLTEAIREFLDIHDLLPRHLKITSEDICRQLSFILSIKIKDPQFLGQTKAKLSSKGAFSLVQQTMKDTFSLWLNQHMNEARKIVDLVISNARERQKNTSKTVRKKILSGPALPGKLTDCTEQNIARTELFLVEGDSAGGSARQARDKNFQAIMPLRGKILNTWEVAHQQILQSEEIHDISIAIGVEPNSHNLENLRYGKICILADADSDGLHIATLLCALFLRHYRNLVEQGNVYVAMPPLYRIDIGKDVWYALDEEEKDRILTRQAKGKLKYQVTRFKGLGEMNPEQLRESTLAPETRRLLRLTLNSEEDSMEVIDKLLAKKRILDRRNWLEEKGNLADI